MVDDIKPTLDGIRRAVEEFGSLAHLAREMGVDQANFEAWYSGAAEMPVEKYRDMLLIVMDWKSRRGSRT